MKTQKSAGGIVVRKKNDTYEVLLLKDKSEKWTFPKGLIEENEDEVTAAAREVGEETGAVHISFIAALTPITYFYTWEGEKIKKTVSYFLFSESKENILVPQTEEGIIDVSWKTIDEAVKIIGYPKSNKPLLNEAQRILYEEKKEN